MTAELPNALVHWKPCVRIIPSRFPPVDLFSRVSEAADLESVHAIEALTEPARLVPARLASRLINAPFVHLSPTGGRFSTAQFGAFYAARSLDTAIAETVYHRGRFLAATAQPAIDIDMRVLHTTLRGEFIDLRMARTSHAPLYHLSDYAASQHFAVHRRGAGSAGVVYQSVRHDSGECVAAWTPKVLSSCRQASHLCYRWDGQAITSIYQKSRWQPLGRS